MPRSGGLQRKFDSGEYQVERVHDKPSVAKSAEVQIFRERLRPNHHSGDILKHVEHGNFLPSSKLVPSPLAVSATSTSVGSSCRSNLAEPGSSGVRLARAGCRQARMRSPSPANHDWKYSVAVAATASASA